jgi:hypothetical protein
MNDPARPAAPEIRPAVFPLPPEDLAKLFDYLRREWPVFIPEALHLILGVEAAPHLLPWGVREPTHETVRDLLRRLEGEDFQAIREVLRELADQHLRQLAERQLDFLESLPGNEWKHPVDVLSRPWHLEGILTLCEERAHQGTKKQQNRRLEISTKLKAAHEIEKRAAARRRNLSEQVDAMVDKVLARAARRDEDRAGNE